MRKTVLIFLTSFLFYSTTSSGAPSPAPHAKSLLGKYGGWQSASTSGTGQTKCHVTAKPDKSEFINLKDKNKKRGRVYILVSRRAHCPDPAMVTFGLGYPVDHTKPVQATIGKHTFDLMAQGERAWALSDQDEIRLIESMKGGKTITVTATSQKGSPTQDIYSLKGFTNAWNRAKTACPQLKKANEKK